MIGVFLVFVYEFLNINNIVGLKLNLLFLVGLLDGEIDFFIFL